MIDLLRLFLAALKHYYGPTIPFELVCCTSDSGAFWKISILVNGRVKFSQTHDDPVMALRHVAEQWTASCCSPVDPVQALNTYLCTKTK